MLSHIYWINPFTFFRLGTMARPRGGEWLESEIKGWKRCGIEAVVSALTDEEIAELDLRNEKSLCDAYGVQFYRLPVEDRGVPTSATEWKTSIQSILLSFGNRKTLVVHCRMGIGRSSMIAVSIMLEHGISFDDAFLWTAAARGLAVPDTDEQKAWILEYSKLERLTK